MLLSCYLPTAHLILHQIAQQSRSEKTLPKTSKRRDMNPESGFMSRRFPCDPELRLVVYGLQRHYRNLAGGLLLILTKLRQLSSHLSVQTLAFCPFRHLCTRLESLLAHLDRYLGVSKQVMVPIRI